MCMRYDYVRPPRWLRRWSVSGPPGRRGALHAPLRSASCLRSQRGWWRRCGPGWPASSVEEGASVRVWQPPSLKHVGRQWFSRSRSPPPRRGGKPTSSWPAYQVPGYPRRVPGVIGRGGVRRWRHGRLAAAGQRDVIHGCGQFQNRSCRGCP